LDIDIMEGLDEVVTTVAALVTLLLLLLEVEVEELSLLLANFV
jgi:hypothetical protein